MKILNQNDYDNALIYATKMHEGQKRIGGKPYITHPVTVSLILKDKGYGFDFMIAGLFHDLLEDTKAKKEEILNLSNSDVLEAVCLLTKEKNYIMKDYVKGIKSNKIAFAVKEADRLHNLKSALVADETFKRKYILETIDWYWDFSKDIREATKVLAKTLKEPIKDYPMLYENSLTLRI